jgi:hypothetical protein
MASGGSSQNVAPNLYKNAIFKNRVVAYELHEHNWIKSIQIINSPSLVEEFVTLFIMINGSCCPVVLLFIGILPAAMRSCVLIEGD